MTKRRGVTSCPSPGSSSSRSGDRVGRRTVRMVMSIGLLLAAASCGTERNPNDAQGAPSASAVTDTGQETVASDSVPSNTAAPASTASTGDPTTIPPMTTPEVTTPEVTAADVLERNPLYVAGPLQDVGCSPVSSTPLDTVDNMRAFYASVLPCLDAAWAQVSGTGIGVPPAGLQVFTGPSVSSCLNGVTYSFYCWNDDTIYMYADEIIQPWLEFPRDDSRGLTKLAAVHTLAHEYGHHIQRYAGILDAIGSDISGTEAERRLELQASCLGNVFLASQSSAYPIAPEYLDEQNLWRFITLANHGSEANQALWTDLGYQTATPGQCNTFSAPAEQVS